MRIILIRHGQTLANAENRFQGQVDYPLSELGKKQAEALVEPLKNLKPGKIYASDLSRSRETAAPGAAALGLVPVSLNIFREYSWGLLEGLSWPEIREMYPKLYDRLKKDMRQAEIPGQEPLAVFRRRLQKGLEILMDENNPDTVALVGHGRYLNALTVEFLNLDFYGPWPFSYDSAAITILEAAGTRRRLLVFNDRCHLQGIS